MPHQDRLRGIEVDDLQLITQQRTGQIQITANQLLSTRSKRRGVIKLTSPAVMPERQPGKGVLTVSLKVAEDHEVGSACAGTAGVESINI